MAATLLTPAGKRVDPLAIARRVRQVTLLLAVGAGIWIFTCFGTRWVPPGMDAVLDAPPGSYCILDKRASSVKVGSNVFVDVPGVGVVLSRIDTMDELSITLHNPNPLSQMPDSRALGPVPRRCVLGVVLGVFPRDSSEVLDGK